MPRNVEVKARIDSIEDVLPRVLGCTDGLPQAIAQDDTFFACASGRLKLRVFCDGRGELIAYRRPDTLGPKVSDYLVTVVDDPDALRATLACALGIVGRVVKQRTLLLAGRTRVHLDRVEGLGDFLELEVVLRDDESADDGAAVAHAMLNRLGVDAAQLVTRAYLDLLRDAGSPCAAAPVAD